MSRAPTSGVASTPARRGRLAADDGATITPVGVDVGTRQPYVATTPTDGPADAVATDGRYVRALYKEFQSATERVAVAPAVDETTLGDLVARYWPRFRAAFATGADRVLEYAREHPAPVVVLEVLPGEPWPLVEAAHGDVRLATWCPPIAQAVLADRAVDAGLSVATVDAEETSTRCHRCGTIGELGQQTLACPADDCPVEEVCRDRSAAVSIAQRFLGDDPAREVRAR